MPNSQNSQIVELYNAKAGEYAKRRSAPDYWEAELAALTARVPADAHLLEIGTGVGYEAAKLLAAGYAYTGLEPSEALRQIALECAPDAKILVETVQTATLPAASYDGWLAIHSLLHIPREELPAMLIRLQGWLKPSATGLLTLKAGTGESRNSIGVPLWLYTDTEIQAILTEAGYTALSHHRKKVPHRTEEYLCYVVENN